MLPLVGSSKPAIMDKIVVLPQPDGPIIEINSPSAQLKLRPWIAVISLLTV